MSTSKHRFSAAGFPVVVSDTPDRVKNAVTHARQYSAPGSGERDHDEHLASVDGLVFGEDPSEGFVRGRRYPASQARFHLHRAGRLRAGKYRAGGARQQGRQRQAMRLDVVRVPAEQTLSDYLKSGWIGTIDDKSVEPSPSAASRRRPPPPKATSGSSGSTPCASAAKSIASSSPPSTGPRKRARLPRLHQQFPPHDAGRDRRRPAAADQGGDVAKGDTPERLASRMAISDRPLQRFLVLNGLASGQARKPGDKVKIVVE